jgi:sensor histidine kinase YesM
MPEVNKKTPWQAATDEERARFKRRLNFFLGWIALAIYAAVVTFLMVTLGSWTAYADKILIGILLLVAYAFVVTTIWSGIYLYRSRDLLEATEWMRRGGLMASPSPDARPDESRIRMAVGTLPQDIQAQVRVEVETYLAMPDDDEKQLRRDQLIREFYELAGSSKDDFAHRKAYNELRLALSPWSEPDSG